MHTHVPIIRCASFRSYRRRRLLGSISLTLLVAAIALCCAGCEKSSLYDRVIVTGTVTYQGAPIGDGMVQFVPIEGTKGTSEAGRIVDGTYTAKAKGGVPVGTHRVKIQGFQKKAAPGPGETPGLAGVPQSKQQYLPAKYNSKSELKRTVESSKNLTMDFTLE